MNSIRYRALDELCECVRVSSSVRTWCEFRAPFDLPSRAETEVELIPDRTVLVSETEICADDFVATFPARVTLSRLQSILAGQNLTLPYQPYDPTHAEQSIGEMIGLGLPHALEGRFGSWRDWILGMTMVASDGVIVKTGSKVTKSVAGFDVHKLLVGARGTLAIPAAVTLRVWPLAAVSFPDQCVAPWNLIHRVLAADFVEARRAHAGLVATQDETTATLLLQVDGVKNLTRFIGDWVIGRGLGTENLEISDPGGRRLLHQAQLALDPSRKLNPGALGVI